MSQPKKVNTAAQIGEKIDSLKGVYKGVRIIGAAYKSKNKDKGGRA